MELPPIPSSRASGASFGSGLQPIARRRVSRSSPGQTSGRGGLPSKSGRSSRTVAIQTPGRSRMLRRRFLSGAQGKGQAEDSQAQNRCMTAHAEVDQKAPGADAPSLHLPSLWNSLARLFAFVLAALLQSPSAAVCAPRPKDGPRPTPGRVPILTLRPFLPAPDLPVGGERSW